MWGMSANKSVTNSFRSDFLLIEMKPKDASNVNWVVWMMITELTKKQQKMNWKMDKNDPVNRVRKYLLFAFDYSSTFQRDFNAMLYFL